MTFLLPYIIAIASLLPSAYEGPTSLTQEIESIDVEIRAGDFGYIDKFIVVQKGETIFSATYAQDYSQIMFDHDTARHQYNYDHPDWHPFYMGTKLHSLQSVTKSVTSLLMGIAHDKGFIPDVQAPAQKYLTSMPTGDPMKTSMKITDLLTMRCGLLWDESNYSEAENNCIVMELKDDWIDYVLTQPMDVEPGTKFVYNSGASVLLGKIVREATGMRIDKWAEKELFGPIGITDYHWKLTPMGEVDTEGGLYLTSEDLLKIGMLVMNNGLYDGKQIVSEKWIEESTNPLVKFDENSGYAYQWWVPGFSPKVIAGNGYGGQFLFIVPEHETIVVFNGWNIHDRPSKSSYAAFFDRLLPIIRAI